MHYHSIIIGAGHNGLVAAALLAKAGRRVLVLEKRDVTGGVAATEELFPGFLCNTGADDAGLFQPEVFRTLALDQYGVEWLHPSVLAFAPQTSGPALILYPNPERSQQSIARFSHRDAERFPEYAAFVRKLARPLREVLLQPPPDPFRRQISDLFSALKTALSVRGLGPRDMMAFLRALPMSAKEFLDDWFDSDALKGVLGFTGTLGAKQGPLAAGTAFLLLYHMLGCESAGFRSVAAVKGGVGRLADALVAVVRKHGGEVRTGEAVRSIIVENGVAKGVHLRNGEDIRSDVVLATTDPRRTFFQLAGPAQFSPEFNRKVRAIKFRGTTAKVILALDGLPEFKGAEGNPDVLQGHIVICPSLEYLERAYDDAKYGRFSERPCLDIMIPTILDPQLSPEGKHIMSITFRYAPYNPGRMDCENYPNMLLEKTIATLEQYTTDLRSLILHKHVITPMQYEREYGLTEGSIFHGQMGLDQLLFMRPIPGWGQYETPIEGVYLCGAGTHPGGGVTGAPGYNAAQKVLALG